MRYVPVSNFKIGKGQPLAVMSGPCVIESESLALETAEYLRDLFGSLGINFIYKSSAYDNDKRFIKRH